MVISGFTFARNSEKLYYPIKESILSILDMVDEFVVALGNCDSDDKTHEMIESIGSPKIRVIETKWEQDKYPNNVVYAQQTDLARMACSGDWLFYLQNDEVIHEEDHGRILAACEKYRDDYDVDGLLFEYLHFWGDYDHYHQAHNWYPREIRIIKNDPGIHSWKDAQSFRRFSKFGGSYHDYVKKNDTSKLRVARIYARIFHYGWVRPPDLMTNKAKIGNPTLTKNGKINDSFDYGAMDRLAEFTGTHPEVMKDRIAAFDWGDHLQRKGPGSMGRSTYKHERLKYRILTWIEYNLLGGRQIGGFRNYKIVKDEMV